MTSKAIPPEFFYVIADPSIAQVKQTFHVQVLDAQWITWESRNWATPPVRLGLSGGNSGKNAETPHKRSQSVSWNSPREYGWDLYLKIQGV